MYITKYFNNYNVTVLYRIVTFLLILHRRLYYKLIAQCIFVLLAPTCFGLESRPSSESTRLSDACCLFCKLYIRQWQTIHQGQFLVKLRQHIAVN